MILNEIDKYTNLIDLKLLNIKNQINNLSPLKTSGVILSAVGTTITASLPNAKIGDLCLIVDTTAKIELKAEVISVYKDSVTLLPFGGIDNISTSAKIFKLATDFTINVGDWMRGCLIDGLGNCIGSIGEEEADPTINNDPGILMTIKQNVPDPLKRPIIDSQFLTGVKSIDLFISSGVGQRLAIFAAAGMGKTTLMGMILRNCSADIVIVALIGERGREVQELIQNEIHPSIYQKCIIVVTTSDRPPVEQVKSAYVAQTIAEYFRNQGKSVLLFVDSITRFARAQREIGLSAGEPVARGGFPPSVFLAFPKLMERAGNSEVGSITAFYTVLLQNDVITEDPIADEIKSIVDGHIILSRELVERSHFPAIDILSSLSRVATLFISKEHAQAERKIRQLISKYNEIEFLLRVGEYKEGNDALADESIAKYPQIMEFLQQDTKTKSDFNEIYNQLCELALS